LLGAVGVAAEWRSGRTIQPVVTAAKAAVRCSMYLGLCDVRVVSSVQMPCHH
jgi:hypothetical protein